MQIVMHIVDKFDLERTVSLTSTAQTRRLPEFRMADCEPEVHRISGMESHWSPKFQELPHIFDHARINGDTADIARRRPTSAIQNGGLLTGSTLYL
jgi:hypothetical protein